MNFSAVILAGGRSTRMGRDKALLPFNGRPLIEHALGVVCEAGAGEVLISGRAGQDFSALDCSVLLDAVPGWGPLGGIERALNVAKYPLVLVLAVDLPHMTPECLRRLCGHAGDDTGKWVQGVVPILNGRPEPLAALYPKCAHQIVKRRLDQERLAARSFAEACLQQGLASATTVPTEHESCFSNWNTPEDAATGF